MGDFSLDFYKSRLGDTGGFGHPSHDNSDTTRLAHLRVASLPKPARVTRRGTSVSAATTIGPRVAPTSKPLPLDRRWRTRATRHPRSAVARSRPHRSESVTSFTNSSPPFRFSGSVYSIYRRVPSDTPSRRRRGSCQVSVGKVVRFFHGPGKALNFGLAPHSPRVSGPSLFSLPLASPRTSARYFSTCWRSERREGEGKERRNEGGREAIANESFRRASG